MNYKKPSEKFKGIKLNHKLSIYGIDDCQIDFSKDNFKIVVLINDIVNYSNYSKIHVHDSKQKSFATIEIPIKDVLNKDIQVLISGNENHPCFNKITIEVE